MQISKKSDNCLGLASIWYIYTVVPTVRMLSRGGQRSMATSLRPSCAFSLKRKRYLMRNYFPKRPSGAPLHTLSKLYDVPVGFETPPPYIEAEYCLFCGRRRVAVARYRMICLVHVKISRTESSSVFSPFLLKLRYMHIVEVVRTCSISSYSIRLNQK